MSDHTAIEWCDATLNCWWGCTKVSDGCKFCYAEHLADHRHHKGNWGPTGIRQEVKSWRSTLNKISNRAKSEGRRLKVFCQSMSDTFEGAETMGGIASDNWKLVRRLQDELLGAILEHQELDFLLLTKRPENVLDVVHRHDCATTKGYNWQWPSNLWIGTSVEDQKTADERIPHLLEIPAAVRFLSCEPLLGPVDLFDVAGTDCLDWDRDNYCKCGDGECSECWQSPSASTIHWLICGGESGPNARPMHPDWAKSLRDQCQSAGVPFFFKQWGEWAPGEIMGPNRRSVPCANWNGSEWDYSVAYPARPDDHCDDEPDVFRCGKKRAGRILDGSEWSQSPVVTP